MKAFGKYLPLVCLIAALLTISACEDKSPTGTRVATVFTWEYVMDAPTYFHSVQTDVPPLAVEEDGTVWIAGYLGTAGNSHRCIARRQPGGIWQAWTDSGTPGDYYAYDVGVSKNGIYVTVVGNPTLEQSGLYRFVDIPYQIQGFELVYAHPDPGPIACNVDTAVMFTRHMNNANSGIYSFMDNSFHTYTLPNVTGDVLCAAIFPEEYVAVAITSDGYILQWISDQLTAQPFISGGKLYSVSGDLAFVLCTDQGLYRSDQGDLWVKDEDFPTDKAYSHSMDGHEFVLGEKLGVTKVYKQVGGQSVYGEETLNYPVGVGRLVMNKHLVDQLHQGYIYDGNALGERIAH